MTGLMPDAIATWTAAVATIVVLGGMLGERRLFAVAQHLLAGLATGYLAVLALREVVVPLIVEPLAANPGGRLELWLSLGIVLLAAATPWLPRRVAAVPLAIIIGSMAAFALGGAVVGTALPQAAAAVVAPAAGPTLAAGLASLVMTSLVLVAFLHGTRSEGPVRVMAGAGRWLLVAGIGGWLGYLLVSRLILLVDRLVFLLGEWLGLGR